MESLTFAMLNAKIDALPEFPAYAVKLPKKARWGLLIAVAGILLCLLSVKLLPSNAIYTVVLASGGLAMEIIGFIIAGVARIPKKWPTFSNERRESAEELDFDLPHHLALIEWLRTYPRDQRETLKEFVGYRHARMQEKLPMLTGSIEKLGILPIVIALYLQFKDSHWPPHPSWTEIFLIFVLIFGYWLSVTQISVRLRMQLYETLLGKSLGPQDIRKLHS